MRKKATVTIDGDPQANRDAGKTFILTEMDAERAEGWAIRCMGAMQRAGIELPPETVESGMIGMAAVGLRAFLAAPYGEVAPLLAEAMTCVRIVMPGTPDGRVLIADDIEEVSTRVRLRDEVFKLHTGFSLATALLTAVAVSLPSPDAASISSDTPISAEQSEPLSPAV